MAAGLLRAVRLLVFAIVLAGCSAPAPPTPTGPLHDGEAPARAPGPLQWGGDVSGAYLTCDLHCVDHRFETNQTLFVDALLTWGIETNDLDLILLDSRGDQVASSNQFILNVAEAVGAEIEPGAYTLRVLPYASSPDSYELTATFSLPPQ